MLLGYQARLMLRWQKHPLWLAHGPLTLPLLSMEVSGQSGPRGQSLALPLTPWL